MKVVCGQAVPGPDGVVRELTVAVFVVNHRQVLLLFHRKLGMWLPPGGHVEYGELPDDAAIREVLEETGVRARLVGERGLDVEYPTQLVRPYGVQVEDIRPGVQHVDLIYFAVPVDEDWAVSEECATRDRAGWYDASELAALGANDEIQGWVAKAVRTVAAHGDSLTPRPFGASQASHSRTRERGRRSRTCAIPEGNERET